MEAKSTNVYVDLQKHLNTMPLGFPKTKSGSHLGILKQIFQTEDEARVALHMSYKPETVETIHGRMKDDTKLEQVRACVDSIERHGGAFSGIREGERRYHLVPFMPGMIEVAQVTEYRDKGTISVLHDGIDDFDRQFGIEMLCAEARPFRTIPIEQSVTPELRIATYEELFNFIGASDGRFGVINCICRVSSKVHKSGCNKTKRLETCLVFREAAEYFIRNGLARELTKEGALEIARQNEKDGLVLQPENNQNPNFMCSCCSDCCGLLGLLKAVPRPVDFAHSNYHAVVDENLCVGCGTCEKRCQMDAIKVDKKVNKAHVNLARCIGCGVCVPTCKKKAAILVRKAVEHAPEVDYDAYKDLLIRKKK